MVLDLEQKTFVIHIAIFFVELITIYPAWRSQIALLKVNKAFVNISKKYLDFIDIFSKNSGMVLLEYTKLNSYAINLEKNKQPLYGPIYSVGLIKLKSPKIYIKTNLANGFIRLSKSFAYAPILFNKKLNGSF